MFPDFELGGADIDRGPADMTEQHIRIPDDKFVLGVTHRRGSIAATSRLMEQNRAVLCDDLFEWDRRSQRVMVMADGFAWNGQTYDSLSKVAFAITGTNGTVLASSASGIKATDLWRRLQFDDVFIAHDNWRATTAPISNSGCVGTPILRTMIISSGALRTAATSASHRNSSQVSLAYSPSEPNLVSS
jgi:hypothetical protein